MFIARDTIVHLNVTEVARNPVTPLNFDVPLLVSSINILEEQWDLTTRQVRVKLLSYISQ